MDFEYDPVKSRSNADKHGIDFEQAQELWADDDYIETAAKTMGEARWRITGKIHDTFYTAIVTYRGAVTRIISVRRAHEDEVRLYEQDN